MNGQLTLFEAPRVPKTYLSMESTPAPCLNGGYCAYAPYERCGLNCKDYEYAGACFKVVERPVKDAHQGYCIDCGLYSKEHGCAHHKWPYNWWLTAPERRRCEHFKVRGRS